VRQDNEITEVEMGAVCGTRLGEDKLVQEFWWGNPIFEELV
jgi:hypothetical protein